MRNKLSPIIPSKMSISPACMLDTVNLLPNIALLSELMMVGLPFFREITPNRSTYLKDFQSKMSVGGCLQ